MPWQGWLQVATTQDVRELWQAIAQLNIQVELINRKLESAGVVDMSRLHDTLNSLVTTLDSKADTVIATATENETQFQDVITKLQEIIAKLEKD